MTVLWLISGPRGSGKTTFCRHFVEYARCAGWNVAGLLSPAVFDGDSKTGILAEDLRSGETRPLASKVPHLSFDLPLGNWYFDRATLHWGNHLLETCLPCDLLIVDELGPLEFQRGRGWTSALATLRQPQFRLGLAVVRSELLEIARVVLPAAGTIPRSSALDPAGDALHWWKEISEIGHG